MLKSLLLKIKTSNELIGFLWEKKLWWLIPLVVFMLMFGFIFIFATVTGMGPFIYALF